jgi:hypothetical protein
LQELHNCNKKQYKSIEKTQYKISRKILFRYY